MLPRLIFCLLVSLHVLLMHSSSTDSSKTPVAPASPSPPPLLDNPSWALGVRLYQALRSEPSSVNTLFSPLLLASSLGALADGSAGKTADQIQDLLKPSSKAKGRVGKLLSVGLKSFVEANGTSFQMHTSSGVFTKQAPVLNQAFAKNIQGRFRLQHQTLGKGDSKADMKQLNAWRKLHSVGKKMLI